MVIKLPKQFFYTTNQTSNCAYVSNGILYIEGYINFEDLMYSLTYALYGYEKCRYCGKELTATDRTLDHIYPRSWGGVSLTDNLLPSCKTCNQSKADMAPYQFNRWRKLESHDEQREYYRQCQSKNAKRIHSGEFILPKKWLTTYDTTEFCQEISFDYLEPIKIEKVREFYEENHQYNHPIVVSSNDWLLKGKHILYQAKQNGHPIVPAIVLENVVVVKNAP